MLDFLICAVKRRNASQETYCESTHKSVLHYRSYFFLLILLSMTSSVQGEKIVLNLDVLFSWYRVKEKENRRPHIS